MQLPPNALRGLLARAKAAQQQERAAELAAMLRSFYYPKQGAFFTSPAKRRASRKTRRAGATTGGCRELLARGLTVPKFRATYIGETRKEAKDRAWQSDTQSGLVDLLQQYGTPVGGRGVEAYEMAGQVIEVRTQDLALDFSGGGRIDLFGADDERSLNKQRGNAKHLYWVDEAQAFRWLERFYKSVAAPALVDFDGEFWMTGTPDKDPAGMFWEITRDDGELPLPGWDVFDFAAVDNPFFGATPEERWARTAQKAREENGWAEDDPDFLREWCGKWVKSDARYVYPVHAVPVHELCYAPQRLTADGFLDIQAALRDLPGYSGARPRPYFVGMGFDLGTVDDFAIVLDAWSLQDPILYELGSWKRPNLDYDEMFAYIIAVMAQVHCSIVVGDAGGGGKPAVKGWSKKLVDRYNVPIVEATKQNKEVAIKQWGNDIRRGLYKYREGSPLLAEQRVHRWATKRSATGLQVEDPATANHACDAGLYIHRESYHHRFREPPRQLLPNTPEWVQREERELEDLNCAEPTDPFSW